jgi:UPF0755 protein
VGQLFLKKNRFFIIEEGQTDKSSVTKLLESKEIIKNGTVFSTLGSTMGIWEKIRPGKYEVKQGQSLLSIARMLRANKQAEVKLIITQAPHKGRFRKVDRKEFLH